MARDGPEGPALEALAAVVAELVLHHGSRAAAAGHAFVVVVVPGKWFFDFVSNIIINSVRDCVLDVFPNGS